jgi:hypothetical protein
LQCDTGNEEPPTGLLEATAGDDGTHRPPAPTAVHTRATRLGDLLGTSSTARDEILDHLAGHTRAQANKHLAGTSLLKHSPSGDVSTKSDRSSSEATLS